MNADPKSGGSRLVELSSCSARSPSLTSRFARGRIHCSIHVSALRLGSRRTSLRSFLGSTTRTIRIRSGWGIQSSSTSSIRHCCASSMFSARSLGTELHGERPAAHTSTTLSRTSASAPTHGSLSSALAHSRRYTSTAAVFTDQILIGRWSDSRSPWTASYYHVRVTHNETVRSINALQRNPAIALRLQSAPPAGRVAELLPLIWQLHA